MLNDKFTLQFKGWIERHNLRIKDVAERLDIRPQTLSNWMHSGIPEKRQEAVSAFIQKWEKDRERSAKFFSFQSKQSVPAVSIGFSDDELRLISSVSQDLQLSHRETLKLGFGFLLDHIEQEASVNAPVLVEEIKKRAGIKKREQDSFKQAGILDSFQSPISAEGEVAPKYERIPSSNGATLIREEAPPEKDKERKES